MGLPSDTQGLTDECALNIGRIGRPHGLQGTLRLFPHSGNLDVVDDIPIIWIGNQAAVAIPYRIAERRYFKNQILVDFDPQLSREQAELLRGEFVWVDRAYFADDDGWFLDDLIGATVLIETGASTRDKVGKISAFADQGGQNLIEIDRGNRVIYIPWVDAFVTGVQEVDGVPVLMLTANAPIDL